MVRMIADCIADISIIVLAQRNEQWTTFYYLEWTTFY